MADEWEAVADGDFHAMDSLLDAVAGELLFKADVHGEEDVAGAEVHGHGIAGELHAGLRFSEAADLSEGCWIRAFADDERLAFRDEQHSDEHEDETDHDGGDAVCEWPVKQVTEQGADERGGETEQGGCVLDDDGEGAGVLAGVDGGKGCGPAFGRAELAQADEEGVALKDGGDKQRDVVPKDVVDGLGMADVGDALGEGDAAADEEDEERDQEGPEVEFLAVAEGVSLVGGLAAEIDAEDKQGAVAGVDDRVNAF